MNVYLVIALCFIPLILIFVLSTFFTKLKISTGIISVLFALLSVIPITFIQYLLTEFLPSDFFSSKNGIFFLFVKVLFFAGFSFLSMIGFAYPDLFLLLLLPLLLYYLAPSLKGMHGDALRVTFIKDLMTIVNKTGTLGGVGKFVATSHKWRKVLLWLIYILLVICLDYYIQF